MPIKAIYDLREYGWIHTGTTDSEVLYTFYEDGIRWEIIEKLNDTYSIRKNMVVKFVTGDFQEVVNYLITKKLIKS